MTRQMALGLVLAMAISSAAVDAQMGGLLKRKAGEIVGGKKPAPTTEPAPSAPPDKAPATPATGGAKKGTSAKSDPLAISDLPVSQSTTAFLRGETELPFIPSTTVAAARVLGESAQVALVDTVGAAVKSLVMSPAFLAQHNEYIENDPTVEKAGKTVFVNAADEKRSALWKACFRAGAAPTAAGVKLAKAWLSEL